VQSRSRPPSIASSPTERRDSYAERISTTLDQPMARTNEFKEGLLQRDGYRCTVTGDMDFDHWESLNCPQDITDIAPTEGAHIIPFSYAVWDPKRVCSRILIKTGILTSLRTISCQTYLAHGRFSGAVSLVLGLFASITRVSIVYAMVLHLQTGFINTLAHSEWPLNAL
jgi:hypothetical protein